MSSKLFDSACPWSESVDVLFASPALTNTSATRAIGRMYLQTIGEMRGSVLHMKAAHAEIIARGVLEAVHCRAEAGPCARFRFVITHIHSLRRTAEVPECGS